MKKGEDKDFVQELTSKSENFSQWYVDVIRKAGMADYTTLKGCMVIKPYGFGLWENVRDHLDRRIKATGHKNAYFPLFVPESLLQKEADHVEGFAPQVAWVTQGGDEVLEERLAIRPTSEAIICSIYSNWVQSYRDLPILINQWANVVRWEKVTRLFLRTTEFLWQEGHTVHRTYEDAQKETMKMLQVYKDFYEQDLAIPVIDGEKSESERFAGALKTYTVEAMMSDGKALQAGTSHNLGQHFAKVFDIKFLDEDGVVKYAWQTSWGISTRSVGGIVMVHGDDYGLVMPPKVAPIQAILIPIIYEKSRELVLSKAQRLLDELSGKLRIEADLRDTKQPGWKFNEYELKGVPIRIELGPKDIEKNQAVVVRRDDRKKIAVALDSLESYLNEQLDHFQRTIYDRAKRNLEAMTKTPTSYDELVQQMDSIRGFARIFWCGSAECEAKIKEDTKATIRAIPLDQPHAEPCLVCGKEKGKLVYVALAY